VPSISGSLNAARTLIELFDHKTYLDPNKIAGKEHGIDGLIRFENVHFRYPTRPHVPVLRGLNIEVKPGQFVALCGQSGCGKSTVISLLERYYDPLVGSITVDGERLTDLNLKGFRSQVALVAQESQLYDGTIRENVLLGSPRAPEEVSEEEIWQACREANIATFIQSLPDGLDTDLGGKGTQVSGGQRSRMCVSFLLVAFCS
jgi:ATP-binding cassette subfamily B (MDR/TAP) protein 1